MMCGSKSKAFSVSLRNDLEGDKYDTKYVVVKAFDFSEAQLKAESKFPGFTATTISLEANFIE